MSNPKVTGLRSAEFRVPDIKVATRFYEFNWGLEVAAEEGDTVYLRGTGKDHHALALSEGGDKKLLAVNLAADDKAAVDGLYEKAKGFGASVEAPKELHGPAGGYGFIFHDLDGRQYRISSDLAEHEEKPSAKDRPKKA
ncbi:MAG: VOC family protein [Pseudomonadota bacterium]|nr:VOC family protein [Pseudomonadota bacterium]